MRTQKSEGFIWLVYPEFRRLRIPYAYNGHSYLDARLPAPSDGTFLGKSGLGPYFVVATSKPAITVAAGWQAMPHESLSQAGRLDPRCSLPVQLLAIGSIRLRNGQLLTRCRIMPQPAIGAAA